MSSIPTDRTWPFQGLPPRDKNISPPNHSNLSSSATSSSSSRTASLPVKILNSHVSPRPAEGRNSYSKNSALAEQTALFQQVVGQPFEAGASPSTARTTSLPIKIQNASKNPETHKTNGFVEQQTILQTSSDRVNSAYLDPEIFWIVNHKFEYLVAHGTILELVKFFEDLPIAELHAHFEGLLSPYTLFLLASKQEQLRWHRKDHYFVTVDKNDTPSPDLVPLKDLTQSEIDLIKSSMGLVKDQGLNGSYKNPALTTSVFFAKLGGVRESLMNALGIAICFPKIYEYFQENRMNYVELMTVLTYKKVEPSFKLLWEKSRRKIEDFLALPEVQKWIEDQILECQATMDDCQQNLNKSRRDNKRRAVDCFKIDPYDDNEITVRFIYEIMRNQEPDHEYEFLMQVAATCKLNKVDPRVLSWTLCGPQADENSQNNRRYQSRMIAYMHTTYGKDFHFNPHFGEISESQVGKKYCEEEWNFVGQYATTRVGHAVCSVRDIGHFRENNLAVEACLKSNQASLNIKPSEHPVSIYAKNGVPVVLCSDDPGVIDSKPIENYAVAAKECGFSLEQILDAVRASAKYSSLTGESIYEDDSYTLKHFFNPHSIMTGQLSADARKFVESSERAKLEIKKERDIHHYLEIASKRIQDEGRRQDEDRRHLRATQSQGPTSRSGTSL